MPKYIRNIFKANKHSLRSPSTHNMSNVVRKLFLEFLPKMMMMRRTKYSMPDYDDNAPNHGYINEMDVRLVQFVLCKKLFLIKSLPHFKGLISFEIFRDSVSDFTSDFTNQDGNFENIASNVPHTSGKNSQFDLCPSIISIISNYS